MEKETSCVGRVLELKNVRYELVIAAVAELLWCCPTPSQTQSAD